MVEIVEHSNLLKLQFGASSAAQLNTSFNIMNHTSGVCHSGVARLEVRGSSVY